MLLSLLPVSVFAAEAADGSGGAQLQSDVALTIPGYTRVTSMPADGLSGEYLIVATYNGNYYMLYPGATGGAANANNAARLVVDGNGTVSGYRTKANGYDSTGGDPETNFSVAENYIQSNNTDVTYSNSTYPVYSVTAANSYKLFVGTNPIYSDSGSGTSAVFFVPAADNTFLIRGADNGNSKSALFFYSTNMNFNQQGTPPSTQGNFMLFQRNPLTIEGYTRVTSLPAAGLDGKYLIVAPYTENDVTSYYMLYPGNTSGNMNETDLTKNNSARLVVGVNGTVTGYQIGCKTHYDNAEISTNWAAAQNTITKNTDGTYSVMATGPNGEAYALANSTNPVYNVATSSSVDILNSSNSGYLTLKNHNKGSFIVILGRDMNFNQMSLSSGSLSDKPYYSDYILFKLIEGGQPDGPGSDLQLMLTGDLIGGANGSTDPAGQNSWVFTGGRAAQGSFADVAGARTWAGHFEEYVRYTNAKQLKPSGEADTPYFQRHVINAAYEGQKLADIVSSFDTRIAALKPRAVVYLVDENGSTETDFATNLNSLITNALALKGGTGMIVIETLTQADKTVVDGVVNALDEGLKPRVLPVLATLTAEEKTGDYPNAQGHLAMAKQLADAVAGSTVSSSAGGPYDRRPEYH